MAIPATITINAGDIARKGFNQFFEPIVDRCRDVSPAWDVVRQTFFGIEERLFEQEGQTSEHSKWAPLSESYNAWKQRVSPGDKILQLGGETSRDYELIKELTGKGPYVEYQSKRSWYYGTEAKAKEGGYLATIHTTGLPHRIHPMPAREPIRLTEDDRQAIAQPLIYYVLTGRIAWRLRESRDKYGWLRANPEFA